MKTHPILFSTPMVEAILSGRKKQTRRVLKPQPQPSKRYKNAWNIEYKNHAAFNVSIEDLNTEFLGVLNHCPFGKIGDILWVRESFYTPIFERLNGKYYYKADLERQGWSFKWKPSIHMPKAACRIFLEITSIRVERLNSISENDAIAEGIASDTCKDHLYNKTLTLYKDYLSNNMKLLPASVSFKTLWQSINGMNSWASNPWVWVIEFKRIEKPENF